MWNNVQAAPHCLAVPWQLLGPVVQDTCMCRQTATEQRFPLNGNQCLVYLRWVHHSRRR